MMLCSLNAVYGFDNVILQVLLNSDENLCTDKWGNSVECCEENEWDLISQRFYTMSINQRQLRGESDLNEENAADSTSNVVDDEARKLSYSRYCANSCRWYATGRCLALNCKGYRRSVMETMRELFWSTNCENQKSEVNNLLNNMANNNEVGENCKILLRSSRKLTCFSNVEC